MKEIHSIFLDLFIDIIGAHSIEHMQCIEQIAESLHESFFDNYFDNILLFKIDLEDYLADWISEEDIPATVEKVMIQVKEEMTPFLAVA